MRRHAFVALVSCPLSTRADEGPSAAAQTRAAAPVILLGGARALDGERRLTWIDARGERIAGTATVDGRAAERAALASERATGRDVMAPLVGVAERGRRAREIDQVSFSQVPFSP